MSTPKYLKNIDVESSKVIHVLVMEHTNLNMVFAMAYNKRYFVWLHEGENSGRRIKASSNDTKRWEHWDWCAKGRSDYAKHPSVCCDDANSLAWSIKKSKKIIRISKRAQVQKEHNGIVFHTKCSMIAWYTILCCLRALALSAFDIKCNIFLLSCSHIIFWCANLRCLIQAIKKNTSCCTPLQSPCLAPPI